MYRRFPGPKELVIIQRWSHCEDSFAVTRFRDIEVLFHISYHIWGKKIVPCTENFVISRFRYIDKQHRRLVTLQTKNTCIAAFFSFYLYFILTYFIFLSILLLLLFFFFEMQLLVPILSEVFRTVINSIRHFRTEMGTRVEMYPVIQIQFLDGLRNRLQGTCRLAIGQFFFISSVTVPEAFAKPVHTALFPSHFLKGPTF